MKIRHKQREAEKERKSDRARDREREKWYATFVHHNSNHMFAYCYVVYGVLPPVVFCLALLRSTFSCFCIYLYKNIQHIFFLLCNQQKKNERPLNWSMALVGRVRYVPFATSTCFIFGKSNDDGRKIRTKLWYLPPVLVCLWHRDARSSITHLCFFLLLSYSK